MLYSMDTSLRFGLCNPLFSILCTLLFIKCSEFNYMYQENFSQSDSHKTLLTISDAVAYPSRWLRFQNSLLVCITKIFHLCFVRFIFVLQFTDSVELIHSLVWLISDVFPGSYHGMVHF